MSISYSHFEESLSEVSLKHGLKLCLKGAVISIESSNDNRYQAIVIDNGENKIRYKVENDQVLDAVCSECISNSGCKHLAAVLFYIHRATFGLEIKEPKSTHKTIKSTTSVDHSSNAKKKSTTKASKGKLSKHEMIINQTDPLLLRKFLIDLCNTNPIVQATLISLLSDENSITGFKEYKAQIKAILASFGRATKSLFTISSLNSIYKGLAPLDNALKLSFKEGQIESFCNLALAFVDELHGFLNKGEDKNNIIEKIRTDAIAGLQEVVINNQLSEQNNALMFSVIISLIKTGNYTNHPYLKNFLSICFHTATSEKDLSEYRNLLIGEIGKKNYYGNHDMLIRVMSLKTSKIEAENCYTANLSRIEVRRNYFEYLLNQKEFEKAEKLCVEPPPINPTYNFREVLDDWYFDLAMAKGDKKNVYKYAPIAITGYNRMSKERLRMVKDALNPNEYANLLRDLFLNNVVENNFKIQLGIEIFNEEGMISELKKALKICADFMIIDRYAERFKNENYSDLMDLYESAVMSYAEYGHSSDNYRYMASYIQKIFDYGYQSKAKQLVMTLRNKYKTKTLMLSFLPKYF